MKKQTALLTIKKIERLNNSYYGNPKYYIIAKNEQGQTLVGKTATNAAIGYMLGYDSEGRKYLFDYHTTANGNIIFDYAKKID